jgi:hypothetical protein
MLDDDDEMMSIHLVEGEVRPRSIRLESREKLFRPLDLAFDFGITTLSVYFNPCERRDIPYNSYNQVILDIRSTCSHVLHHPLTLHPITADDNRPLRGL